MNLEVILQEQRAFFDSGATLPVPFRQEMLKKLANAIRTHEDAICEALAVDLGKSRYESYLCEIGTALSEIHYLIRTLPFLAARKPKLPALAQLPAIPFTQPSPLGTTLILSPWNSPLLLSLQPLATSLAAGNTVVLKPSSYASATSNLLRSMLSEIFPPEYVTVVIGGREENAELLKQHFDFIFFTGSSKVGKEVLRHAAEHLTPTVLELGGKSPCIVDSTAKIRLTARRIVFGKFLNCGQTCVAPDYILCRDRIKPLLIGAIVAEINRQYGKYPLLSPDYGKIINRKHYNRLMGLIDDRKAIYGGYGDESTLRIAPTIMDNVTWDDPIMQEEVFGPILPVLTYHDRDEVIPLLKSKPAPLALYLFSQDKEYCNEVLRRLSFGGGCINDTVIQLASPHLGFGGVGESGMGSYHGKTGFDAFSHQKSIVDKITKFDLPMRYRPYTALDSALVKLFLR